MINARTGLAAAALAVGAGAVVFLSTNSPQPVGSVPGLGPVPVAPIGMPLPAEPVRIVPAGAPPAATSPAPVKPAAQVAPPVSESAGRVAPPPTKKTANSQRTPRSAQAGSSAPTQQQPQPNGTGGWQLPACYQESCVAPPSTQTASREHTDSPDLLGGVLGVITAPVHEGPYGRYVHTDLLSEMTR